MLKICYNVSVYVFVKKVGSNDDDDFKSDFYSTIVFPNRLFYGLFIF